MKTKEEALEKLENVAKISLSGYYAGFRDAIAFIFEDHEIYKR